MSSARRSNMLIRSNSIPRFHASLKKAVITVGRKIRFLVALLVCLSLPSAVPCGSNVVRAADEGDDLAPTTESVENANEGSLRLRLKNGGFTTGKILPSSKPNSVRWQALGFGEPFDFELDSIRSVSLITQPDEEPDFAGQTRLLLTDGTSLTGTLQVLNQSEVQLQSATMGDLKIDRAKVRSLSDATYTGKLIYNGPLKEEQWVVVGKEGKWSIEDGVYKTTASGSVAVGQVGIPAKARIAISLSWQGSPDFVISFATTASNLVSKADQVPAAARLEVWDKQLALVREVTGGADISLVSELADGNQRIELTLYVDQESGQVIVCDVYGRPLGSVSVESKRKIMRSSIHLLNYGQSLSLEALEIREWDGQQNASVDQEDTCVIGPDGKTFSGGVVAFNADKQTVTVKTPDADEDLELPLSGLRRADLWIEDEDDDSEKSAPSSDTPGDKEDESTEQSDDNAESSTEEDKVDLDETANVQLILKDQGRIIGQLLPSDDAMLNFGVIGIQTTKGDTLRIRPEDICGIVGNEDRYRFPILEERIGTIQFTGTQLSGFLVDADSTSDTGTNESPIGWQPLGSRTASALTADASGVVVYRKPLPRVKSTRNNNRTRTLNILLQGRRSPSKDKDLDALVADGREILFRTGDCIAGVVERVTDEGMYFASPQTKSKFARHEQIQSVQVSSAKSLNTFDAKLMERLKTVPRNKKSDPPTHLFQSVQGDFLRGRLISFSDKKFSVEVRGEIVELDAANISQVIWLHDRDWIESEEEEEVLRNQNQPFMVHAIAEGDRGLTFAPTELNEGWLSGHSELLGSCSTEIEELNQLLFGKNIEDRVREFNDDPWVLSLAQMPRVYLESDEDGSPATGTSSELVGKPAPSFDLATLAGDRLVLEQLRGQVVVLDFWASWCGPCMQSMPAVEEVVNQFGDDVLLVPVNIQEDAERISAAAKRLSLSSDVALDETGQVAAEYQANAIPQTVIIDRKGKVQHVFVGGGKRVLAAFQEALSKTVDGAEAE